MAKLTQNLNYIFTQVCQLYKVHAYWFMDMRFKSRLHKISKFFSGPTTLSQHSTWKYGDHSFSLGNCRPMIQWKGVSLCKYNGFTKHNIGFRAIEFGVKAFGVCNGGTRKLFDIESTHLRGNATNIYTEALILRETSQRAKFMGPTWGPPGSCRPQMGPMLAPWTLLSGVTNIKTEALIAERR